MDKKLKNHVILKHEFIYENGEPENIEEQGTVNSKVAYDISGNKIMEETYDAAGELIEKILYEYDDNQKLIAELLYLDDENMAEKMQYIRNEKGIVVSAEKFYQDGNTEYISYEYNNAGKLIHRKAVDDDNQCEWEEFFNYDDDNLTSENRFEFGEIVRETLYSYDENGNQSEVHRKETEAETFTLKYFYDENKNKIKTLTYNNNDQLIAKTVSEYDDKNQLVLQVEEDAAKLNTSNFVYDEKGNVVSQEEYGKDGELNSRIINKYDENDNIMETEIFINMHGKWQDSHYVIRHQYEYFE